MALPDVLTMTFPSAKALEKERNRSARALTELLKRAKATGRLHDDFAHQDMPLILMANTGVVTAARHAAPDAWRLLVAYLIQALAAVAAQPLPALPTKTQMYRVLVRLTFAGELTTQAARALASLERRGHSWIAELGHVDQERRYAALPRLRAGAARPSSPAPDACWQGTAWTWRRPIRLVRGKRRAG